MAHSVLDRLYRKSPIPLQTFLLNLYAYSLNWERYGRKFEAIARDFERNETLSKQELYEYQRERLHNILGHAYREVPYYRRIMQEAGVRPSDIGGPEDLHKLPILTRDLVRTHAKELCAENIPPWRIRHGHTSGTTGSPLNFLWDTNVCVVHHVADWRQKKWAGVSMGDRIITLQGRMIVPSDRRQPPFWVRNYIHNQIFMSSFHLHDQYLGYYVDAIEKYKPKAIEGYPSSLYILARFMDAKGIRIPVVAVFTSSETLLPFQRDIISKCFDAPIYDHYGMAERVVFAGECKAHDGRHLNSDYSVVEIVNEHHEPVADGEAGTVVGTGLWNYAMPLIRYRTSDRSSIQTKECTCHRKFPLIDPITTKEEDIIVLPDGRLVPSSILTHPFKAVEGIRYSQIVQESKEKIFVFVVLGGNENHFDQGKLIASLRERLGNDVALEIKEVSDIPRTSGGKFRWVISKVPIP